MKKSELIKFLFEEEYIPDGGYDNIAYTKKEGLMIVVTINGEYHDTMVFKGKKLLASIGSQAGGAHIWEKFKVINNDEIWKYNPKLDDPEDPNYYP